MSEGQSEGNAKNPFQVGGSLPLEAQTYVTRQADRALYENVRAGEFCYVLNSRQMGKSSLRVRTVQRLQADGIVCAEIDLTEIGTQHVEVKQWYGGIVRQLVSRLQLGETFKWRNWWKEAQTQDRSPIDCLSELLQEILPNYISSRIVIFIDEIDSVLGLQFPTDDFFALIRACYNNQPPQSGIRQLSFVLLGVTTPSDLIQDKRRTPFNIGQPIALTGFQRHEAQPLAKGLAAAAIDPQAALEQVLYWTGGQPFLTQKLCKLIVTAEMTIAAGKEAEAIEALVRSRIIENWEAQDEPEHLKTIRDRILSREQSRSRLLGLYQQILWTGELLAENSPDQIELSLSGLAVKRDGKLQVYNPIYREVFNQDWVEQSLARLRPYAEALNAWVASEKQDSSRLLRGQALVDALTWKADKSLSRIDEEFLDASRREESETIQQDLEAERRAKQILAVANRKAGRRIRIGAFALAAMLVAALISGIFAQIQIGKANQAQQQANQAQQQLEVAQQGRLNAETGQQKAEQGQRSAEDKQKQAEIGLERANAGLKVANQRVSAANQQVRVAEAEATQAGQERQQAQQAAAQAKQAQQQALANVKMAETTLALADTRLKSTNSEALFLSGQKFSALLEALKAGQQLKKLDRAIWQQDNTEAHVVAALYQANAGVEERNTLSEYQSAVTSVSFSPDGKTIVSGSYDGTVKLWEAATGQELRNFFGHQDIVRSISFSPDGKTIVSGSYDGTVKLWEAATGRELFSRNQTAVTSVSFSPDGKVLASGSENGTLNIWEVATVQKLSTSRLFSVTSVSFSPDGKILASAHGDGTVLLWEVVTGQKLHALSGRGKANSLTFSPDSKTIASGSLDTSIHLWDVVTGEEIQTLSGHQDSVWSVSFSPDGKMIASGSGDETIKLWDVATGRELRSFLGHQAGVWSVSFSPDGKTIASGSGDKTIKLWDVAFRREFRNLTGHQDDVLSLSFSPDSKAIASGSRDKTIKLWDIETGRELRTLSGHQDGVISVSFSPDGKIIASGSGDKMIKLWDVTTGEVLHTLSGHQDSVISVSFSPDGKIIASGSGDKMIKLWDVTTGEVLHTLSGHQDGVISVSFSSDGQMIASGSRDGTIKLWDVATKRELRSLSGHQDSVEVSFSPDSRMIASTGWDNALKLWDVATGQELRTLSRQANKAGFSPDGKTIVSANGKVILGGDGTLRLWDIASGQELRILFGHRNDVNSISFSPDGKVIASGSNDKTIRLWVWDSDKLMAGSCNWISAYLITHPEDEYLCEGYLESQN